MDLPESATFEISVRTGNGDLVLDLDGEFDMHEVEAFHRCIDGALASSDGAVLVDLADVTFIDSSAIQALLMARRGLADQGRELQVRHFTRPVARILNLAGVADLFNAGTDAEIRPSVD